MIRKLSLFSLILLTVPVLAWLSGWQWRLGLDYSAADYALFWITEGGSMPYALGVSLLFTLALIWLTRHHYSPWLVAVVCACSIGSTQLIKSGVKSVFQAPRPFVVAMFDQPDAFYEQSRKARKQAVKARAETLSPAPPAFVTKHQAKEVGYSFPSGHTIFAASWLLLFAGFCRKIGTQAVIFAQFFATLWALLMLISRLRLGMHYPIDLFASIIIAWAVHCGIFSKGIEWAQKQPFFARKL